MKHEFTIAPGELLRDLHRAYLDARKNKRGKEYQLRFEYRLEENLVALRDELLSGRYQPRLLQSRVNSWLGVLSHYKSHCLRRVLFGYIAALPGGFSPDWLRFKPKLTFCAREEKGKNEGMH